MLSAARARNPATLNPKPFTFTFTFTFCPQLTRPLPVPLAVLTWAAKARLSIRQLLIPLSYCCLLGGLNTTIGTSTNLVVTGEANNRGMDAW